MSEVIEGSLSNQTFKMFRANEFLMKIKYAPSALEKIFRSPHQLAPKSIVLEGSRNEIRSAFKINILNYMTVF